MAHIESDRVFTSLGKLLLKRKMFETHDFRSSRHLLYEEERKANHSLPEYRGDSRFKKLREASSRAYSLIRRTNPKKPVMNG